MLGRLPRAFPYRSGAFLFQKSLRVRREVLALPNRITSKISAPLFGARAKLALLHWVAAMGLPVALLAILPFVHLIIALPQPDHYVGSFTRHCFSNSSADGMFPTGHNHLLSCKVMSQASNSGINPSPRWKKLLIRSYPLPVLWTLIRNRVTPSPIR